MIQILAHITENEIPSFWLAGLIGFVAGVAVTLFAMFVRKLR
jgi:hypothetical protein